MSSARDSCSVCDRRIDAYGRDGTRCSRCDAPCPVCNRDVACCPHPLQAVEQLTEVHGDPLLRRVA